MRVAALPRVQATSGSLPRKGLCRSCPSGGCDIKGRNGMGFTGADEESARNVCPLSTKYTHHMPPIRTIGTTPLGLFMSLAFTRGSASAAQPRALWHNTFGVGKEGPRMNADGGTVWKSQSGTHNGVVPRHHICGRIPLGFPDGLFGPPPDRRAATNLVCASFCRAKELQCLHRHGFTSAPEFLFQGRRGPVSGHARSNRKSRGGWPGIPAPL